jgi:hypothetical protein
MPVLVGIGTKLLKLAYASGQTAMGARLTQPASKANQFPRFLEHIRVYFAVPHVQGLPELWCRGTDVEVDPSNKNINRPDKR